jgi:predicted phage baseplate assembly protein
MTIGTDAMLLYEPANDDDEKIGEMVRVLQSTRQGEQTLVTLDRPLLNAYDRSTVIISANVVAATHGQTVQNETVNGIDQSGAYHRYSLKQSPLTYVPATTPDGMQSTLTLLVNQVRWHEVSTIQALMSTRRAYLLQRDSKGNTWIVFSEGSQGAYLFTGKEQITATYRVGIGEAGNVAANSLTMLRTRPPGIQGVTNPIAASGGTEPDGLEQMRSTAPLQVRSMQRIVSLNDYAYFIRMFAGISKVQTTTASDGPTRRVYITIAGADGEEIKKESELYTNLLAAIHAATSAPSGPVSLDSYERLYFQLKARLVLDPDWQDQKETVITHITQALSAIFCFERRDLGQNVSASEVISVIQRIQGVAAVDLENLYIRGKDQVVAFNALLEAKPGRVEGGKFLPAQLLVVNASSDDGIVLSVEGN